MAATDAYAVKMNQRRAGVWLTWVGLALFAVSFGTCLGVLGSVGDRASAWLTVLSGAALLGLVLLVVGLVVSFLSQR